MLLFQHPVGTTADVTVTPSPIKDEDDNRIEMECWTNPDGFYDELRADYGHFQLHNYWSPAANEASSEWILTAAREWITRSHTCTPTPAPSRMLGRCSRLLGVSAERSMKTPNPNTESILLYYWWFERGSAPYYATDMDIHAKPGFDPRVVRWRR